MRHTGSAGTGRAARVGWLVLPLLVAMAGMAGGATIFVPAGQPTIQAAIGAAHAGDKIVVAAGTYVEAVTIDKSVTLVSADGPATTQITSTVPAAVVTILAGNVTLGGPGAGFTIVQQTNQPAVLVRGELVSSPTSATTLTIEGNILRGTAGGDGLSISQNLTNVHLVVKDCTFGKAGGAYGFARAIYFGVGNPGGAINKDLSANQDQIELLNLTCTDYEQAGMVWAASTYKSTVGVVGGSYRGTDNARYGLYMETAEALSNVSVIGTTFAHSRNGIYLNQGTRGQSGFDVLLGAVSEFGDCGIYLGDVTDSSSASVRQVTISGKSPSGAAYGIQAGAIAQGAHVNISDNAVTGFATAGIHFDSFIRNGGGANVVGNTIAAQSTVRPEAAVYLADVIDGGSTFTCADNDLSGGRCGIAQAAGLAVSMGSIVSIEGNAIRDFTADGIALNHVSGGTLDVATNRLRGNGGAARGVYLGISVDGGARVQLKDNCLQGVVQGLSVTTILDTASVQAHQNDFTGADTGVVSGSDAAHKIDARNNLFGANAAIGNVDTSWPLAGAPDEDGDGVSDCEDECPGTVPGQTVDSHGCSYVQSHPGTGYGQVQFSAPAYSVNCNDASVTITIKRTGGTAPGAGVQYATVDGGTAVAGTHYTRTSGTVSFGLNETMKTFSIPVRNSGAMDGNKTVNLSLHNVCGGAILSSPETAVLTIVNVAQPPAQVVPPTISIADTTLEASSAVRTLDFEVSLSEATTQDVTVGYVTVDGSARAGVAYAAVSGTLTIPAGQTRGTIVVPVVNVSSLDTTFLVRLWNAANATIADGEALGTILGLHISPPAARRFCGIGVAQAMPMMLLGLGGMKLRIRRRRS